MPGASRVSLTVCLVFSSTLTLSYFGTRVPPGGRAGFEPLYLPRNEVLFVALLLIMLFSSLYKSANFFRYLKILTGICHKLKLERLGV